MKHFFYKFNKISIVLLVFIFISCSKDNSIKTNNNDDDEIIVEVEPLAKSQILNVSYGLSTDQKYDVYLPEGRTKETTKVFILIHGGGWIGGDKNDMTSFVDLLMSNFSNHAIVNINYRLASNTAPVFPMQIDDIKSVISDLKSKEETYQISNNYGFIGVSAGAQLSLLYSYKYDTTNEISMVCSVVGPTNFTDTNYIDNPIYTQLYIDFQQIIGVDYDSNIEYYESISPYHTATISAPPTILFYGDQDHLIPTSQGVDMHAKLNSLGIVNEFTLYEGEGHGWDGANAIDTNTKLNAFITIHF